MAKLNIVGVGPGSPDYVTPAARKTVQQAKVVIGAQRSLNLFTADIKGETMVLTAKNLNNALKFAVESAEKGKNVALLSTGDPGFSGLLGTVLKSNLVKAVEINVVPGVSSIQTCAARLGISWDDACLFTFHEGNVSTEEKNKLLSCLKKGREAILLPDSRAFPPSEIASFLLKAGLDKETPVFVCENLTLDDERVTSSSLKQVSEQAFESLCVMVIKANRKVKG
ncbi:MAG: precorrin-6y C5,15-methyltransferase (decarboxylating) subunit CbiE [Candidatus Bathyarchaeia archaeon]